MNRKSKSFIEDTLVLLVVFGLIYIIYSFFFASEENTQISENPTIIEKQITPVTKEENSVIIEKSEEVNVEVKQEDTKELENTTLEVNPEIVEPETIKEEEVVVVAKEEEIIVKKEIEKTEDKIILPISTPTKISMTIESFYKTIEEKINSNISKNLNKDTVTSPSYVNIRITILQDGRYEQLTYMEGNKAYFDMIKPSILEIFPLEIDESIKDKFPRYFRMKIEY